MKVFFINSKKFDYAGDLTYSGLVEILGPENIRPYPIKPQIFLKTKKYPKNLYENQKDSIVYIPQKLSINIKNADLVILSSVRYDVFETYIKLAKDIPSSTPVILIDGGDREEIGGDLIRFNGYELYKKATSIRNFDFIFKREYLINKDYPKNIFPYPLSINPYLINLKSKIKKNKMVTFFAQPTHSIRIKAFEILKGKFDCDKNGTFPYKSFKTYKYKGKKYFQALEESKISLSFRGGGCDTLRFWEIPATGTFMITQKPKIVIPYDFEDKKNIVYCKDDLSDLIDLCEYYLKNENLREEISKNSKEHIYKYHTNIMRAKYILEKIKK